MVQWQMSPVFGGVSLLVCVRYHGGKLFGFSFAAVLKNSRRTVCFDKGVNMRWQQKCHLELKESECFE